MSARIRQRLEGCGPLPFSTWCIVAAFGTYFCMYAFRKPFTAGTFGDELLWGIGYKTVLITAQVFGYTLSKFIGIKVISEMPAERRCSGILLLIGSAHLNLFFFGLVPAPYNFVFLFANGLSLGMVFGLVLAFLEGRQLTEALAAGLCASFIVSSGVVKSVGRWLVLAAGVSEFWMPFVTGLLFVPPLLVFVWMLRQIPPPGPSDVQLRSPRRPMLRPARRQFFARHAVGLSFLLLTYCLVTIVRSIRDDFAVEIWQDLGVGGKPAVFTQTEMLVMLGVVLINGAAIVIRDNATALRVAMLTMIGGFLFVCLAVLGFVQGFLPGFWLMVLTGLGMYVPYVAFHTTLFERMIAVFRDKSNIGYLMYLADAVGYLSYVGIMLGRNLLQSPIKYLDFFLVSAVVTCVLAVALTAGALVYFRWQIARSKSVLVSQTA